MNGLRVGNKGKKGIHWFDKFVVIAVEQLSKDPPYKGLSHYKIYKKICEMAEIE